MKVEAIPAARERCVRRHAMALRLLTSDEVDIPGVTSFVRSVYGFTTLYINESRYKTFMRMSGGDEKDPLATIKKINCASLPPYNKTLGNHVKRAPFVSMMWKRADQTEPTGDASPTDYRLRWKENKIRIRIRKVVIRSSQKVYTK